MTKAETSEEFAVRAGNIFRGVCVEGLTDGIVAVVKKREDGIIERCAVMAEEYHDECRDLASRIRALKSDGGKT